MIVRTKIEQKKKLDASVLAMPRMYEVLSPPAVGDTVSLLEQTYQAVEMCQPLPNLRTDWLNKDIEKTDSTSAMGDVFAQPPRLLQPQ